MTSRLTELQLKIHNMHCAACEVRVERKFRKLAGIANVRVNHASGLAVVSISGRRPQLQDFEQAVAGDGYAVSWWADRAQAPAAAAHRKTRGDYTEIGAIFLILVAAYLLLDRFDLLPKGLAINDHMSYGFVFLIGVVASVSSCLAVTGGLLLGAAAKYNERNANLGGWEKFKPTLFFNLGRLVSYTVLGGAIGGLGSVFTLSQTANGVLSIMASLVMITLGFQLLNLFPWMGRFQPRMPKFLAHRIHDLGNRAGGGRSAPLALGALTFFLPCGFTQALQFYALSVGSPIVGALTMFAFALGTLPGLLSLSAISSFARGGFQKHFLRVAGVLVVMVGFWNIDNGLSLTGITLPWESFDAVTAAAPDAAGTEAVTIADGVQTVRMTINRYTYSPSHFTIQAGVPVRWVVDGRNAAGCAQVLLSSSLGIAKYLPSDGVTTIAFTPREAGHYSFSCPMGMTTLGAGFTVLPGPSGGPVVADATRGPGSSASQGTPPTVEGKKYSMEISDEKGFYPNSFTIKQGVPITLEINDKVPLPGCTSVMVIPEYDVTVPFRIGINKLSFTPTKTGTIYGICSMGSKMIRFQVVS